MTFRERVNVADFESEHFATQLVERLGWAVEDADQAERRREEPAGDTDRLEPRGEEPAEDTAHQQRELEEPAGVRVPA